MGVMDFKNFSEFVGFCQEVRPEEWSEEDKRKFNEKVYSLLEDSDFSKKYEKLCLKATKQNIRSSLAKKRLALRLEINREKYRTSKRRYSNSKTYETYR